MASSGRRIKNPILFICDIQTAFTPAIHSFPTIISTTKKLLRFSKILKIPVLATTQHRAKLGPTCPELGLDGDGPYDTLAHADKSAFSMCVPVVVKALDRYLAGDAGGDKDEDAEISVGLKGEGILDCIIVGIETHICVLQTTLDLLKMGHRVWIVQDAVSSCNVEERGVALARLRQEGARVTTSESLIYEILGDAGDESFRDVARLVKESKLGTKEGLEALCRM